MAEILLSNVCHPIDVNPNCLYCLHGNSDTKRLEYVIASKNDVNLQFTPKTTLVWSDHLSRFTEIQDFVSLFD